MRHTVQGSLNRTALSATLHCLTGCAIGEVLGMVIGTAFGWGNAATIAIAVVLAFFFGYSLTMVPLLRGGLSVRQAAPLALASDTLSIAVMEIVNPLAALTVSPPSRGQRAIRATAPRFEAKASSHSSVQFEGRASARRKPTGSAPLAAKSERFTPRDFTAIDPAGSSGKK